MNTMKELRTMYKLERCPENGIFDYVLLIIPEKTSKKRLGDSLLIPVAI